jgi:hypothetical protein
MADVVAVGARRASEDDAAMLSCPPAAVGTTLQEMNFAPNQHPMILAFRRQHREAGDARRRAPTDSAPATVVEAEANPMETNDGTLLTLPVQVCGHIRDMIQQMHLSDHGVRNILL